MEKSRPAYLLLLTLLLSAVSARGQECQFNYSPNAKACPTSGSTLLDDTYPVSTYVISVAPYNATEQSRKLPSDFIMKVLESYQFSENAPNIVVPASDVDFKSLQEKLKQKVAASKGKIPAKILSKVIHGGAVSQSYTWQQDYFESFINPDTGRPVVRQIESYSRGDQKGATNLAKSAAGCNVKEGPVLKTDHDQIVPDGESFANGEMGGNIEGLPGGLCVVGDNLSKSFSKQFCGDKENILQIDVSWLSVGHVDEVFKVIPTNVPGVPKECNFSLMFASPQKAMDLLSEPRAANHPLFSGDFLKAGASGEEVRKFRQSRSMKGVGRQLCHILKNFALPARNNKTLPAKATNGVRQAYYMMRSEFVAFAQEGEGAACEVDGLTNSEFLKAMKDPEFQDYNKLVQKTMDESKKKITEKILSKLPQCKKHLSLIDVPDLFYGTAMVDSSGQKQLPRPGDGGSFMPNPTNAVVANNNIIFSDPQSPLFRDYLTQELKRKNIGASFVDTWDYSHLGDGNLHCSSHSIPYCSPVKKASK